MEQSLFIQWVNKYFPGIVIRVTETLNAETTRKYYHRVMLRKDFSVSGKWESLSSINTLVAADIVAMDSSLPLKKRPSVSSATGDIAKIGMELKLNENQLTALDMLVASGAPDQAIVSKLFADTARAITGIYERLEAMFLEGLSTGVTAVDDSENVGLEVRLDYGYYAANKFGSAGFVWSNASSTPVDDIERVLAKAAADGNTITKVMMDKTAYNNFAKNAQVKGIYAFGNGFTGANIPAPSVSQMNTVTVDRWGFAIELVERSVVIEINGIQTTTRPWADGAVVFLTTEQVGSLAWANLAEMNHPSRNVNYTTADEFILVSKYVNNKPSVAEFTSSQARAVPVISGVSGIYLLDTKTVQA